MKFRGDLIDGARAMVVSVVLELETEVRASSPAELPEEVRAVAVALARMVLDELDPGVEMETVREIAGGRVVALVRGSGGLDASAAAHPSGRAR